LTAYNSDSQDGYTLSPRQRHATGNLATGTATAEKPRGIRQGLNVRPPLRAAMLHFLGGGGFLMTTASLDKADGLDLVRLLDKPAVGRLLGLTDSSIDKLLKKGLFPQPFRLTDGGRMRWRMSTIVEFVRAREAAYAV
jgi:predicted DNA-binding transcriptional regulator AlpA